jgi:hypothetical protein
MTKTVSVSSSLLLRPLPLLLLLFFFSQSPITVSAIVANRNFLSLRDQQDCYTHLVEADVNHDSQLDREEFVTFCNLSSPPNLLFAVTTVTTDFDSLPLSLQAAFYSIACLCNSPSYGGQQQEEGGGQTITTNTTSSEESCCQGASAHVRVPTVGPLDEPSFQDKSYLFATCTVTNRAVEHEMRVHGGVTWPPTTATIPADTMSPSTSSSSSILQTEAPSILDVVPTMVPTPTTTTSDQTTQEPTFTTTTTTSSSALPTLLPTSQRLTVAPTSSTAPVFTASPTASPSSLAVSARPTTMVPTIEESNGAAPTTTTTTTSVSVSYLIAIQRTATNTTTTTASNNNNNNNNTSHLSDLQAAMDQLAPKVLLEEGEQQSSSSSKRRRRRRRQLRPKQTSLSQQQQSQTNETTTTATTTTSIQLQQQQQQQQPQQASSFVQLPTQLEAVQTVDCPTSLITTDSSSSYMECQEVTSIVQLMYADATTSANFDNNLKQAIDQGELQQELLLINSDTPVQVLNTTTTAETTTTTTSDDEDVSKGLTAGIVVASVATVALVFVSITLLWNQKHLSRSQAAASRSKSNNVLPVINSDDDDDKDAVPPLPTATESSGGSNLLLGPSYSTQATIMTSTSSHDTPSPPHHPYLAASVSSETTDSVRNLPNDVEAGLGVVSQQQQVVDKADAATVQASGESTSSGATAVPVVSSDTSSMYAAAAIGGAAAAAMFGCGAGLVDATRSTSPTSSQDTPNQNNLTATESRDSGLPYVTLSTSSLDVEELEEEEEKEDKTATNTTSRQRLDQAIQAGDWAAVGQIAAVLAASSPEQPLEEEDASASSMPLYSLYPSRSMESNISVEIAKMELLDQLVEKERWQDVMVMAAKFEAEAIMEQQSSTSQSRGESEDAESTSVNSRTTGGSFTGSEDLNTIRSSSMVSPTTSFTDSFGRTQLRAEIREEVVALVQMVVPEELDNVDEMMKQFHGREDELIETLRSMQERMVALKARSAMQKAAKAEARMQVKSQRQSSESDPHQSETADVDISALSEDDVLNDILGNQLENEIFPGTGALLSLYPNSNRSTGMDAISNNGIVNDASIKLHTSALEHAVHVGNWQAVTEAAAVLSNAESLAVGSVGIDLLSENRDTVVDQQVNPMHLRELDDMIVAGNWSGVMEASKRLSKEGDSPSEERRSKEEEEALQQAALWEKIAEESKSAGGSNDAGAVDATEWAIQRSLSELNLKEQEQQSQQSSANEEADDRASDDEV